MRVSDLVAAGVLRVEDGNHGEYRPRPDEFVADGVPFIRAADMSSGVVDFSSAGRINDVARQRIHKGVGAPGDVLLSHKGTVGKVAVAPLDSPDYVCSPQTTFWRSLKGEVLDQRYLSCVMRSKPFALQLDVLKGQTDMAPYVSLTDQRTLLIPVPSVEEQRGIAEVLGALDDKIAANTRLRSASENLLRANFEALGIDTSPVEGTQLHEVVALNPTTPKPAEEVAVYLEMKHLPDSSMTVTSWSYREPRGGARFVNGDTLLARITPCLENGKTGHVDFLAQGQVGIGSTEYIVMRAKTDTPTVLPYFLATSPAFRDVAIRRMVGTSGRQRLSAADIADYLVSWPSADKLVTFDRLASSLMPRVKAATDETRHLIETRDALLPLLMSGKVSVKDAESVVGGVI